MARFPQVDWVAVNGRDTPFTKPQHYTEGSTSETDSTGHDNPLPTTDKSVRAELESIKATQAKILERLDEPLDTQLTGSNVEDEEAIPVRSTGRMKVVSNLENIEFSAGSSVYLRHLSEGIITDIDTITILLRWLDTEPDDYNIVVSYYSSGTTSNGVTMEDTYSKDILKKEIKLLSPYVSVYLMNKTTTDATIRTSIVTGC